MKQRPFESVVSCDLVALGRATATGSITGFAATTFGRTARGGLTAGIAGKRIGDAAGGGLIAGIAGKRIGDAGTIDAGATSAAADFNRSRSRRPMSAKELCGYCARNASSADTVSARIAVSKACCTTSGSDPEVTGASGTPSNRLSPPSEPVIKGICRLSVALRTSSRTLPSANRMSIPGRVRLFSNADVNGL